MSPSRARRHAEQGARQRRLRTADVHVNCCLRTRWRLARVDRRALVAHATRAQSSNTRRQLQLTFPTQPRPGTRRPIPVSPVTASSRSSAGRCDCRHQSDRKHRRRCPRGIAHRTAVRGCAIGNAASAANSAGCRSSGCRCRRPPQSSCLPCASQRRRHPDLGGASGTGPRVVRGGAHGLRSGCRRGCRVGQETVGAPGRVV